MLCKRHACIESQQLSRKSPFLQKDNDIIYKHANNASAEIMNYSTSAYWIISNV